MMDEKKLRRKGLSILAIVIVSAILSIVSRYMITKEEQKKEQEQQELQEQYSEETPAGLEQPQEVMRDVLQESSEFSDGIRQRMDQMLEDETMTQTEYDALKEQFGF